MFVRPSLAGNDNYIYFLISGLIPWLGINEGLVRSTTAIVENGPVVRRLSLNGELLIVVPNASAVIFECIGLAIFIAFIIVRNGFPSMIWLLPFALAIQFCLQLGCGLFVAATYVFFRDLSQVIGFLLSIIFYLSPVLYSVPARFSAFFRWNPLTTLLGLFRSAMLSDALPEVGSIVFLLAASAGIFFAGLLFFRRVEPGLVDLV